LHKLHIFPEESKSASRRTISTPDVITQLTSVVLSCFHVGLKPAVGLCDTNGFFTEKE